MAASFARLPLADTLAKFPVCGDDSLREKSGEDGTEPVLKRLQTVQLQEFMLVVSKTADS